MYVGHLSQAELMVNLDRAESCLYRGSCLLGSVEGLPPVRNEYASALAMVNCHDLYPGTAARWSVRDPGEGDSSRRRHAEWRSVCLGLEQQRPAGGRVDDRQFETGGELAPQWSDGHDDCRWPGSQSGDWVGWKGLCLGLELRRPAGGWDDDQEVDPGAGRSALWSDGHRDSRWQAPQSGDWVGWEGVRLGRQRVRPAGEWDDDVHFLCQPHSGSGEPAGSDDSPGPRNRFERHSQPGDPHQQQRTDGGHPLRVPCGPRRRRHPLPLACRLGGGPSRLLSHRRDASPEQALDRGRCPPAQLRVPESVAGPWALPAAWPPAGRRGGDAGYHRLSRRFGDEARGWNRPRVSSCSHAPLGA